MTWVTWRQLRTQALVIFGGLAMLAVAAIITGLQIRNVANGCAAPTDCNLLVGIATSNYVWMELLLRGATLVVPVVTGMFLGAPLIAREFETGTYRMAWTQSVSRTRWLAVKVLIVGAASVLASGLVSWITTWWFGPDDSLQMDKFVDATFGIRDVAPLGYAAFAFAVGLTAGLLFRRVLPAMATTLVVFVAARMMVQMLVRQRFATPISATFAFKPGPGGSVKAGLIPDGSWISSEQIFDPSGHPVRELRFGPGDACVATNSCLNGYTQHVEYQPWNRYWPFQWTEFGLFLAIALVLIGFCFWWINGHRLPGSGPRVARTAAPRSDDERTANGQQAAPRGAVESNQPRLMGVDR
jgi:hypothetical protein